MRCGRCGDRGWFLVGFNEDEMRKDCPDCRSVELEAQAAGEERHDELVEAYALIGSPGNELLVECRGAADKDAAVGGHVANDSACAIDNGASAGNINGMSRMAYLMEELGLRMLGDNVSMPRYRWEELLDELRPDSDLARRIRELIA